MPSICEVDKWSLEDRISSISLQPYRSYRTKFGFSSPVVDAASAIDVEGGVAAAIDADVVSVDLAFVVEKCLTVDGVAPRARMAVGLKRWAAKTGRFELASTKRSLTMTL